MSGRMLIPREPFANGGLLPYPVPLSVSTGTYADVTAIPARTRVSYVMVLFKSKFVHIDQWISLPYERDTHNSISSVPSAMRMSAFFDILVVYLWPP